MLSGLFIRSAFVFKINSLIFSGFPLNFFHLAEANLVPIEISKQKTLFRFRLTAKRSTHYLLFRGIIFLCVQLP